jgi:long-subunit acyl-CoA synthetase (AMP-forming)
MSSKPMKITNSVPEHTIMLRLNLFRVTPLDQVWAYGNSFESFLAAVVVPEMRALEEWAAANNKAGGFAELCNDMKARGYILDELNKTGKKLGVSRYSIYYFVANCRGSCTDP